MNENDIIKEASEYAENIFMEDRVNVNNIIRSLIKSAYYTGYINGVKSKDK